jgi:hypothetical protein
MGMLKGPLDEIIFIDENGWAWKGPVFSRFSPVPLDKRSSYVHFRRGTGAETPEILDRMARIGL